MNNRELKYLEERRSCRLETMETMGTMKQKVFFVLTCSLQLTTDYEYRRDLLSADSCYLLLLPSSREKQQATTDNRRDWYLTPLPTADSDSHHQLASLHTTHRRPTGLVCVTSYEHSADCWDTYEICSQGTFLLLTLIGNNASRR